MYSCTIPVPDPRVGGGGGGLGAQKALSVPKNFRPLYDTASIYGKGSGWFVEVWGGFGCFNDRTTVMLAVM